MMGYLRHECIVVSGEIKKHVIVAHEMACAIYNEAGIGSLVSGLVHHDINGGAAFFIAPDGSKEGWESSDRGDKARNEFIAILRSEREDRFHVDWVHLLIGGDDGEYRVLRSTAGDGEHAYASIP